MYCRSRPQYRSDLGWILGVAFLGTLTRSARPVRGFTFVRCCSTPSGFFPTRPRGAKPDCLATLPPACSCLRLAVATNSLRRGLAPPIQGPCLAHQGCSLRSHRLRRLKPLTPTLPPAVHSAMPSMLHCCTSDLKRRFAFAGAREAHRRRCGIRAGPDWRSRCDMTCDPTPAALCAA
jgi:hypothetical protein